MYLVNKPINQSIKLHSTNRLLKCNQAELGFFEIDDIGTDKRLDVL